MRNRSSSQPVMTDDLYHENQILRRKLRAFLSQARENEQKQRRFHEQELRLISTPSLTELVQRVLFNYRTAFGLDVVSIVLHDPEYEIQRIFEDEGVRLGEMEQLLFQHDLDAMDNLFGVSAEPKLGMYRAREHRFLFAEGTTAVRSVALLPLVRYGNLIGSLNLGSEQETRYIEGAATDFLQRLATVVAICLENATNHERLKRVGLSDSLTGVNNRRFFDQRLLEEVGRARRTQEPLTCLFMDVDHFKRVNDEHGHQTGDQVRRVVAGFIREQLRASDVLGRYGGEEFIVIMSDSSEEEAKASIVKFRLARKKLRIPHKTSNTDKYVTTSAGVIVQALSANSTIEKFVKNADNALYQAKEAGRNQWILYKEDKRSRWTYQI